MNRKTFIKNSVIAGGSIVTPTLLSAQLNKDSNSIGNENIFHCNYAPHEGMFKNNAGSDFLDQIKFAYDNGFRAIEDNNMMQRPVEQQKKIGDLLAKLGMSMGVFVITSDNWHWKTSLTTGKQEWIDKMVKDCNEAVEVAKRCHAKWATVVPGNFERTLSHEYQTINVVNALLKAAAILEPHGLIMVLEPLSDNPDLFLRHSDQAYLICKAVGSPSCKILFDIYHMQRMEGNIAATIAAHAAQIAHIQIADSPGRNQPGTGELRFPFIFEAIIASGYAGAIGLEYHPLGASAATFGWLPDDRSGAVALDAIKL
jgi:hydroxypyruvate isomerase